MRVNEPTLDVQKTKPFIESDLRLLCDLKCPVKPIERCSRYRSGLLRNNRLQNGPSVVVRIYAAITSDSFCWSNLLSSWQMKSQNLCKLWAIYSFHVRIRLHSRLTRWIVSQSTSLATLIIAVKYFLYFVLLSGQAIFMCVLYPSLAISDSRSRFRSRLFVRATLSLSRMLR